MPAGALDGRALWRCRKPARGWRSAARNTAQLEELAVEIRAKGREAFAVTIDMASAESIHEAFAKTSKDFGPVAILVNNAGITKDGLALRMKKDDWDSVLATNLTGSFLATQQVLQAHDAGTLGAHYQHLIGGRRNGESRAS